MTHPSRIVTFACAVLLAACSGGGTGAGPESSGGIVALQARNATAGKETQVTLRTLSTAGTIVTMVGEINYDTSRLTMKRCVIGAQIGQGTAAAKTLHMAEPSAGTIRTVVAGGLEALPATSEVLTCTFAVASDAPAGATAVRAHGEVADTTFEDRPFSTEGEIIIGN